LFQIYEIRASSEQYSNLTKSSKDDSKQDNKNLFTAFSGIEPLHYNPTTENLWQSAVAQYNRSMISYDQKVSQILKEHFSKAQSNPQQVYLFKL
jgi:hypothetical protein